MARNPWGSPWGSFGFDGGSASSRAPSALGWDSGSYANPFKDPSFGRNRDTNIYDQNEGLPALGLFSGAYDDPGFSRWINSGQTRALLTSRQQAHAATRPGQGSSWFNFLSANNPYDYYRNQVNPRERGERPAAFSPFVKFLGG